MPEFAKSEQQFKRENFPYPKPQEQIGFELWLSKVTNPSTGTYYQLSDLPAENRRNTPLLTSESQKQEKDGNPVNYPIKHVLQMVRVQAADEKEYLSSFQEWFAIDKLGNELNEGIRAPETWDNYTFTRSYIPKDKNNPDGPKEPKVTGIKSIVHEFTMPFTTENADRLYEMRRTKAPGSVSLSIKRVGWDGTPMGHVYQVEKYEDLISKKFDDLWEYMSAPIYRSNIDDHKDGLNSSHIG
jgi:hypothetical protein